MNPKEIAIAVMNRRPAEARPFMPITMAFAARRIGVPYRRYATDAATQAEGQMKVAADFGTSHVSAISDPCVEAHDLGAVVTFPEDATPYISEENSLLADKSVLAGLRPVDPGRGRRMSNRLRAVQLLAERSGGELLVEGWVEGPCAEAADLRGINRLMMDFFDDAPFVSDLMDFVTDQAISFALAQLEAGADIIGIGDAASSLIGPGFYHEFSAPRTKRYVEAIHDAGGLVRLHICGRTEALAGDWKDLKADMIDVDAGNSLKAVRTALGPDGAALAGNLDPVREVRDSNPGDIDRRLAECEKESSPSWIIGAGCEIPVDCPDANLRAMENYTRG